MNAQQSLGAYPYGVTGAGPCADLPKVRHESD